jgi:hypothetical protein
MFFGSSRKGVSTSLQQVQHVGMARNGEWRPVAGVDYPRDWHEFEAWFTDEAACRAFLERLRWPEGFLCPACAHRKGWRRSRDL